MGKASEAQQRAAAVTIAGRYNIESLLGKGGMSSVYVALDVATQRSIALKQISSEANPTVLALFQREYQTLASLRDPRIVEVYDYGDDAQGAFYTMELLQGSDLSKQAQMSWRDACACLRDVAAILGVLHARHLVHRDLSPKNIWRTADGRLKLIDFGALTRFGPSSEVVGTPPFIPPEALGGAPLDQRSDLFALGALGYWLVTGVHAFPARQVSELAELHVRLPTAASQLRTQVANDQQAIPPELDQLLTALLRIEPAERPSSTAELIDRLNALVELESEQHDVAAQAYLESKAFVGRASELELLSTLAAEAKRGRGKAVSIEGAQGAGCSRLLQEIAVRMQLAGAVVLEVDARFGAQPHAAALELLRGLQQATPGTMEIVSTHSRALLQSTVKDSLLSASRERFVTLLVDDLQAIDEESQGVIAALALEAQHAQLLVVASLRVADQDALPVALAGFRRAATRLALPALSNAETTELLHSVFGATPYLERCAQRLHRACQGNPGHCLELAKHLISTGAARYVEGSWELPKEFANDALPTRKEAQATRLGRLPLDARALAQVLSIPRVGPLSLRDCLVISELDEDQTQRDLRLLTEVEVLHVSSAGYRFVHEDVRDALQTELGPARRARANLRLGLALYALGPQNHIEQLRASVHLLRGGDVRRACKLLQQVGRYYEAGDFTNLRAATPMIEEIHGLLHAAGADSYALAVPSTMLAVAGYFVDRRYAERYGATSLALLEDVLHLALARRLRPFLGATLSLLVALGVAGLGLWRQRAHGPSLKGAITHMLGAASALNGTAATSIDPVLSAHCSARIEPFSVLGPDHVAGVLYEFSRVLAKQGNDGPAEAAVRMERLIARLESDRPIRDLSWTLKQNFLAGLYTLIGLHENWRDLREPPAVFERIAAFGALHQLYADHMRMSHYARHGDVQRAAFYRERIEIHAVQLESAWQVETWGPADTASVALWTHDATLMNRVAKEFARLKLELPTLALYEKRARGNYLVLRGKYAQALPFLDAGEEPLAFGGWAQTRGMLARAYNRLGEHARARQICLDALTRLAPADLEFVVLNLIVQIERALADAGLGNLSEAKRQLDELIALHAATRGPLSLGALHEARAKVALQEKDLAACRVHLDQMSAHYRPTGIATLLELVNDLERKLAGAGRTTLGGVEVIEPDEAVFITRLQTYASELPYKPTTVASSDPRAEHCLQLAIELTNADSAFIQQCSQAQSAVAWLGAAAPSHELLAWATQLLKQAAQGDEDTVVYADVATVRETGGRVAGAQHAITFLRRPSAAESDPPYSAIVLSFKTGRPRSLPAAAVSAIEKQLAALTSPLA